MGCQPTGKKTQYHPIDCSWWIFIRPSKTSQIGQTFRKSRDYRQVSPLTGNIKGGQSTDLYNIICNNYDYNQSFTCMRLHALTNIRLWTYPQPIQHIPVIIPPTTQLRLHLQDPGLHRIRNCARARCSVYARDTPNLLGTPGKIGQHALWSTWIVGWESWYYTDYNHSLITYDVNESHAIKMPQKELLLTRTVDPKTSCSGVALCSGFLFQRLWWDGRCQSLCWCGCDLE